MDPAQLCAELEAIERLLDIDRWTLDGLTRPRWQWTTAHEDRAEKARLKVVAIRLALEREVLCESQ